VMARDLLATLRVKAKADPNLTLKVKDLDQALVAANSFLSDVRGFIAEGESVDLGGDYKAVTTKANQFKHSSEAHVDGLKAMVKRVRAMIA